MEATLFRKASMFSVLTFSTKCEKNLRAQEYTACGSMKGGGSERGREGRREGGMGTAVLREQAFV
jgi:hypothetical protein